MRKTSKDYRKEQKDLRQKLEASEARIKARLLQLIEKFPEAIVVEKGVDKFKAKYITKAWIDSLSIESQIDYIEAIEQHNAKQENFIQTTIY